MFAFENNKDGLNNILDMLTWRSFGVDATSWMNMKYASFNHCLVVFEVDEGHKSINFDKLDSGVIIFKRDILQSEIISIENLLTDDEYARLNNILINFKNGEILEGDIEECLNIDTGFKTENYPNLTNLEYLKMCNQINDSDWKDYLSDLAKDLLNNFINEGFILQY